MEKLKTLLKVLVMPLIVAILPLIYQEVTKPEVKFEYGLFQGPAVYEDSLFKKIVVISFYNTGSQKLNNVLSEINIDKGEVKTYSTSGTKILRPNVNRYTNKVELDVSSMLPSDSLSLSILVVSNDETSKIEVSARSDEIIATEKENRDSVKYISLVCALLTFIVVILLEISTKKGISNLERKCANIEKDREKIKTNLAEAKKQADELKMIFDKMRQDDMLFYLSLLIQDGDITAILGKGEVISYPRMSDIIYRQYTLNTSNVNYVNGQFCLLILTIDVVGAQEIVKNNLLKMGWTASALSLDKDLFKNLNNDYLAVRNEFDQVFKLGVDEYMKSKQIKKS